MLLLEKAHGMIRQKGYEIENLDMTVFAQAPKLSPYRDRMESKIAQAIGIDPELINIKFKTTEELGFVGKDEGMATVCIALLNDR